MTQKFPVFSLLGRELPRTRDDQVFRERGTIAEWRMPRLERLVGSQTRAAVKEDPMPAVLVAETLGLCLGRLGGPRIFDLRDPGGDGNRDWWSDADRASPQQEGVTEPGSWRGRHWNGCSP